jgi:hypothetical protein
MNKLYGNYRTRTLNDIYGDIDSFKTDFNYYSEIGLNPNFSNNKTIDTLFYLLCGKYGNSHIANADENQFKLKLFSYVFQFAPYWEKSLDIQNKLRSLTEDEILAGSKQLTNHSYNPSTEPSGPNVVNGEIISVNEQHNNKFTKGKVNAYGELFYMLRSDVTEEFLGKFKRLFIYIVEPESPLWYVTDIDNQEDINL